MLDQIDDLLTAGIWLGPAVLGILCYRLIGDPAFSVADDLAGVLMLATAALILTAAGVRQRKGQDTLIVPAVFAMMFAASWPMF